MRLTTANGRIRLACHVTLLVCAGLTPAVAVGENGCSTLWSDYRDAAQVEIVNNAPSDPYRYTPRCAMIVAGTTVIFRAQPNFGNHPLYAGTIENGVPVPDPGSPIGSITSGTEATRVLSKAGEFPYYCDFHYQIGMQGSILVFPQQIFTDGFDGR